MAQLRIDDAIQERSLGSCGLVRRQSHDLPVAVMDVGVPVVRCAHRDRPLQFSGAVAPPPHGRQRLTDGVEHRDPVLERLQHEDPPLLIDIHKRLLHFVKRRGARVVAPEDPNRVGSPGEQARPPGVRHNRHAGRICHGRVGRPAGGARQSRGRDCGHYAEAAKRGKPPRTVRQVSTAWPKGARHVPLYSAASTRSKRTIDSSATCSSLRADPLAS